MTTEDIKLLREVQQKDDEEMALQKQSARYRNSDKKLFETVVARVEHVISELLQNADDAEASKVRIDYADGVLTFQHDGKDFEDDQFRSICSFAVSSKRTFKTTGFRGIGFKSTFSLGDTVHLITPRFQVKFERARFTYPVPLDGEKPAEDYRISEHLWKQRRWLALDGVVRSLDDFEFVHADLSELPVDKIVDESVLTRTADFGVIAPLPEDLKAFPKRALIECLECEINLRDGAEKIQGGWLGAIAQVLWTEAENASENQEMIEAEAMKWRNADVLLDPSLSQRFTRNGHVVAAGIKLDAEWVDEGCFAIRADDEDAVCELTEEIGRRLKQPLLSLRTKTAAKLALWVTRSEGQIKKLGIKALQVAELRPWPDEVTEDNTPAVSEDEGAAETSGASDQQHGVGQDPKLSEPAPVAKSTDEVNDNPTENDAPPRPRLPDAVNSGEAQSGDDTDSSHSDSDDDARRRHRGQRRYAETNGERQRSGGREPSRSRPDTPPPPQSGERMRSYVEHSLDRRERERQRTHAQEDGAAAEDFVVAWEQKQGRPATRLGGNNPGYDIASKSKDGTEERFIEVKSIAGEWGGTGVRLTPTQFACAEHYGDRYWLYVVEDAKTGRPIVHAIQNPAAHISAFCFDCGWREIAEATTKEKTPSLFAPKVGDTVIFDEQEVVVEKVETRGAFVLATFKIGDRTYRKMNTALSPKE